MPQRLAALIFGIFAIAALLSSPQSASAHAHHDHAAHQHSHGRHEAPRAAEDKARPVADKARKTSLNTPLRAAGAFKLHDPAAPCKMSWMGDHERCDACYGSPLTIAASHRPEDKSFKRVPAKLDPASMVLSGAASRLTDPDPLIRLAQKSQPLIRIGGEVIILTRRLRI